MELARGDLAPIGAQAPVALVTIVGEAMGRTPGVAGRFLSALGSVGINVLSVGQSATARSVSCVVDQSVVALAVETVHSAFHFTAQRLSLFLLGAGTVGGALIDELSRRRATLLSEHDLAPALVGVATSDRLAFSPQGLETATWRASAIPTQGIDDGVLDQLARLPVPVLVDCTAAEGMETLYEAALTRGIHVVVANKKAFTTPMAIRDRVLATARRSHRAFRYEATVGAALPVINTLHDLVRTGDTVTRIEGALSGSRGSFASNSMRVSPSMWPSVKPRNAAIRSLAQEDLSGLDAARKALILARELGLSLELADVEVTPLAPAHLLDIEDPGDFMAAARAQRDALKRYADSLRTPGHALRYVAVIDPAASPALRVGPQAVPADHPAARVTGNQAFVAFTTRRYAAHPLVVQGAGAGGEITASGVLAEVFRIGKGLSGPGLDGPSGRTRVD